MHPFGSGIFVGRPPAPLPRRRLAPRRARRDGDVSGYAAATLAMALAVALALSIHALASDGAGAISWHTAFR